MWKTGSLIDEPSFSEFNKLWISSELSTYQQNLQYTKEC